MKAILVILLGIAGSILFVGFVVQRLFPLSALSGRSRKTLFTLFAIIIVVPFAVNGYFSYRDRQMDRLFEEASDPQFFRSSDEVTAAVKRLATYQGRRATQMLLSIALSDSPLINVGEARSAAMEALGKRGDPDVALALAKLLQPHEGLDTRQQVAAALQDMPCNTECAAVILHYLERVWRGEPNYEDRTVSAWDPQEGIAITHRDQQALYASLDKVLKREKVATLTDLAQVYGLGSDNPSLFALDLVSRLGLPEACPYLDQSEREFNNDSAELYKAPRKEVQAAIDSLKCK